MNEIWVVTAGVVGAVVGFVLSLVARRGSTEQRLRAVEQDANRRVEEASREAEARRKELELEAKDRLLAAKTELETEFTERRKDINALERRVHQKEEAFERKVDQLEKREQQYLDREKSLSQRQQKLKDREGDIDDLVAQQRQKLEQLSKLSAEDARTELFRKVEEESRLEAARIAKRVEEEARDGADKKAKHIIGMAIQRFASDYVADATVTSVNLPSDEMKGRIIGREGRNIRALEAATGIDLIIDDTPETVILSSFDPVRREVARVALERLISDGRIHPARIEEVVEKVRKEVNAIVREEGEKAVFDLGLSGIHPEIVRLLGRLKYRTSYAQNVLAHSREVSYFAGVMAAELGANVKLAKRGGLLHDIGKSVDHEIEGTHQSIGGDFAKKHGENELVVNAIMAHHGDEEFMCLESALVAAADALSAARPGARRESIENYIKRLEKLEELALSFNGVEKCYAIQAGREVRVMVKPDDTSDEACFLLSRDLAKKIEQELRLMNVNLAEANDIAMLGVYKAMPPELDNDSRKALALLRDKMMKRHMRYESRVRFILVRLK